MVVSQSTTRTMSEPITVSSEPTVVPEESRLQAVFLDMDGTLIESEGLWNESEAELVAELGGVWTEEDHRRNVGNAAEPVGRYIIELTGAPHLSPRQVADQLYARFRSMLAEGAEVRPGAHELDRLLADSPVPVWRVASSGRSLIDTSITSIGLQLIGETVAGDEDAANKPQPDPNLRAAPRLGVDPGRCVAVEDSVVGLTSAADAGCVTIAIPNHV